jgi:type II secretory pathway component PulM
MDAGTFAHVNWRLRGLARGLDWTLVVALALIAFNVAFYFSAVGPSVARTEQLRAQAAQLNADHERVPGAAVQRDPRMELADFYGALAPRERVPDLLRRLHQIASAQGLAVEQADYRPVPDPHGRLTRYQLTLPAKGTYPEVRRFLAHAGKELPGLALDGVAFQRQQAGDELIEAQVKLTLFIDAAGVQAGSSR